MSEVGEDTHAVYPEIFGQHADVIVTIALDTGSDVFEDEFMDTEDAFMNFGRQNGVHTLIESLRE